MQGSGVFKSDTADQAIAGSKEALLSVGWSACSGDDCRSEVIRVLHARVHVRWAAKRSAESEEENQTKPQKCENDKALSTSPS